MKKLVTFIFLLLISGSLYSQDYEIKFDSLNASGWYGGDNRVGQTRTVGVAQSITIEQDITLESFAFYFTAPFDSAVNGTGTGHEVTLKLNIRDSLGVILQTNEVVVGDTFTGGWVFWENLNLDINTPTKLIFSTYLAGAYDSNMVNSGQGCDLNAGYPGGERYGKDGTSDQQMEEWSDWSNHPWDSNFWLKGKIIVSDVKDGGNIPDEFILKQNFPNPFNPSTEIKYELPFNSQVKLTVYDLLGNQIADLVNKEQAAGKHTVTFDASRLTSGIYFYQIHAGEFISTMKMTILK